MIGFLRGVLLDVLPESALVDVGGVGYEVACSQISLSELEGRKGDTLLLWIHTHVREDALQLFGFLSRAEKDLFLSLLKVNGVGPKLALGLLSGAPADRIVAAIESGDAKALSALPKVGKKTAEQIILTLQGKLVRVEKTSAPALPDNLQQIQSALVHLGFKSPKVSEFVSALSPSIGVEEGVRQGLNTLSKAHL